MRPTNLLAATAERIGRAVHTERCRAHEKFKNRPGGSQENRDVWDHSWIPVIGEELGEVCRVINEYDLGNLDELEARAQLRVELVQMMAMCQALYVATEHFPLQHSAEQS